MAVYRNINNLFEINISCKLQLLPLGDSNTQEKNTSTTVVQTELVAISPLHKESSFCVSF